MIDTIKIVQLLILFLILTVEAASDTTFSKTKKIKLEKSSVQDTSITNQSNNTDTSQSSCSSEEKKDFFETCLCNDEPIDDFKDLGARILIFPFRFTFCLTLYAIGESVVESNKYLFVGARTIEGFGEKKVTRALHIGIGALWYPEISLGVASDLTFDCSIRATNHLIVRGRVGFSGTANYTYTDFGRDVFVDGVHIGVQYDDISNYKNRKCALFVETLFKPRGRNGSLFLFAGAGPVFTYEKISIYRTTSFDSYQAHICDRTSSWQPVFSCGIGRFALLKTKIGVYEIGYYGIINKNAQLKSMPSDNSAMCHSLMLRWGLLF